MQRLTGKQQVEEVRHVYMRGISCVTTVHVWLRNRLRFIVQWR